MQGLSVSSLVCVLVTRLLQTLLETSPSRLIASGFGGVIAFRIRFCDVDASHRAQIIGRAENCTIRVSTPHGLCRRAVSALYERLALVYPPCSDSACDDGQNGDRN